MADTSSRSTETIRLAGKDTRVIRLDLPLGLIDLDPENPRVGLFADTKAAATGQPQTQAELEFAIRNKSPDMYVKLRQAIEANQGLMTPIWVQERGGGRYVTIEGNTRVIAYRDLHQKLLNDQTYAKIPARVLPGDVSPQVIHFVRIEAHLRGVTPWEAYDRARYLYYLYDKQGMPLGQLARLTRLTEKEILNSIAAYRTMTEHYLPTYKDPNEVLKFSYFAEYHSKKSIQDAVSRNGFSIQDLCSWIGTRKLPRAADIRDLPDLLDVPEVRDEFVSSGYESAMELLAYIRPSKASPLFINIGRVIRGLDEISPTEIADLKSGRGGAMLAMLNGLDKKLDTVLSLVESGTRARKRP
jgi:hypothetical protein